MLDRDTVIRSPHASTVTRSGGKKHVEVHDPRVSVAMQEQGVTLTLFFEAGTAWTGTAPLLEVRLEPPASTGPYEPVRLMPRLPFYLQYARATLAHNHDDVAAALRALRQLSSTRRGLSDDFVRLVAQDYTARVAEGEPHPVKALAEAQGVDKSTASRWITEARRRGFIPEKEEASTDA
jgi:hypothetical protein